MRCVALEIRVVATGNLGLVLFGLGRALLEAVHIEVLADLVGSDTLGVAGGQRAQSEANLIALLEELVLVLDWAILQGVALLVWVVFLLLLRAGAGRALGLGFRGR